MGYNYTHKRATHPDLMSHFNPIKTLLAMVLLMGMAYAGDQTAAWQAALNTALKDKDAALQTQASQQEQIYQAQRKQATQSEAMEAELEHAKSLARQARSDALAAQVRAATQAEYTEAQSRIYAAQLADAQRQEAKSQLEEAKLQQSRSAARQASDEAAAAKIHAELDDVITQSQARINSAKKEADEMANTKLANPNMLNTPNSTR